MPVTFNRAQIKVVKKIAQLARDGMNIPRGEMLVIGKKMADKVRVRTRLGRGVDEQPLEKLSPAYIDYRKYLKDKGRLYEQTNPKRSNLTLTGQLLNSLFARSDRINQFTILVKENRIASDTKNSDIVRWQKTAGRDFLGLSEPEVAFLRNEVIKYFKRIFKL